MFNNAKIYIILIKAKYFLVFFIFYDRIFLYCYSYVVLNLFKILTEKMRKIR